MLGELCSVNLPSGFLAAGILVRFIVRVSNMIGPKGLILFVLFCCVVVFF